MASSLAAHLYRGEMERVVLRRSRARTMQENPFANALDPSEGVEQRDWREQLRRDYRESIQRMTFRAAVAHRLGRVYPPLLIGLFVIRVFHLIAYGDSGGVIANAAIENVSGRVVVTGVVICYVALVALALF